MPVLSSVIKLLSPSEVRTHCERPTDAPSDAKHDERTNSKTIA